MSLLLLSDFGIDLAGTPLDILECQTLTESSHEFKVDTVKSFTVVDEAAYKVQPYFAGMGNKCNSSIVLAVNFVLFLV